MDNSRRDAIAAEIVAWIVADRAEEGLDAIAVSPASRLLDEQVFDSMKLLEFVGWLEETYAIAVGPADMTPLVFETPNTVANYVLAAHEKAQAS